MSVGQPPDPALIRQRFALTGRRGYFMATLGIAHAAWQAGKDRMTICRHTAPGKEYKIGTSDDKEDAEER